MDGVYTECCVVFTIELVSISHRVVVELLRDQKGYNCTIRNSQFFSSTARRLSVGNSNLPKQIKNHHSAIRGKITVSEKRVLPLLEIRKVDD